MEVAEEPDEAPLSILDDNNCLESEEDPTDADALICVSPGTSLCEGIDTVTSLGDDYLINAAPCLLFPPDDEYELDFLMFNTLIIVFDSYDFDDDEDALEIEVYIPDDALTLCEDCFAVGDDDLTITADASIAGMSFDCSITVSDENHAVTYNFTVAIGDVTVAAVTGGGFVFMSISEDDESFCIGATVSNVDGGRFYNAAPCLLTPPDPTYELAYFEKVSFSYDAFDMEEDELTPSWSVD